MNRDQIKADLDEVSGASPALIEWAKARWNGVDELRVVLLDGDWQLRRRADDNAVVVERIR